METTERNARTVAGVLTGLLILFFLGGAYYWNRSRTLTTLNDKIEQRADSLLSAKLQLEGDIRHLTEELNTAQATNTDLTAQTAEAKRQMLLANQTRTRQVADLRRTNANRNQIVQELNRDIVALTAYRDDLQAQLATLRQQVADEQATNKALTAENTKLSQKLTTLDAKLLTMVPRSALTADDFRVEAVKSNRKLTAKAKKIDALSVSFSLPVGLGLVGNQEVYLSLTNSDHQPMFAPLRTLSINLNEANEVIPVHAIKTVDFDRTPQRISFQVKPDESVKPGTYRVSVYTKTAYLGSVEVEFRNSFWFF